MPDPYQLEEIRDGIIRKVRDLPAESLTELAKLIMDLERLYDKSLPPIPPGRCIQ